MIDDLEFVIIAEQDVRDLLEFIEDLSNDYSGDLQYALPAGQDHWNGEWVNTYKRLRALYPVEYDE